MAQVGVETAAQQIWNDPAMIEEILSSEWRSHPDLCHLLRLNKSSFVVAAAHLWRLPMSCLRVMQYTALLDHLKAAGATEERIRFYCSKVKELYTVIDTEQFLVDDINDNLANLPSVVYEELHTIIELFPSVSRFQFNLRCGGINIKLDPRTGRLRDMHVGQLFSGIAGRPRPLTGDSSTTEAKKGIVDSLAAKFPQTPPDAKDCPISSLEIYVDYLSEALPTPSSHWYRFVTPKVQYINITYLSFTGALEETFIPEMLRATPFLTNLSLGSDGEPLFGHDLGLLESIGKACPKLEELDFIPDNPGPAFELRCALPLLSLCPALAVLSLGISLPSPPLPVFDPPAGIRKHLTKVDLTIRARVTPYAACADMAKYLMSIVSSSEVRVQCVGDQNGNGLVIVGGVLAEVSERVEAVALARGKQWAEDVTSCIEVFWTTPQKEQKAARAAEEKEKEMFRRNVAEMEAVPGWAHVGPA